MDSNEEQKLDHLLSGGRVSGPDLDRVWGNLKSGLQDSPKPASRRYFGWWLAGAGSAAGLLALVLVLALPSQQQKPREGMNVKGAAGTMVVEAGCRHGDRVHPDQCWTGDSLLMRVDGLTQEVFLAAYAIGPDGRRIWYFPDNEGYMPRLGPTREPELVPRSVLIGPEHPPGKYLFRAQLFDGKITREQAGSVEPLSSHQFEITVKTE